ncbi:hypothetical protein K8R62_02930, partial [bacterium]|nr:hypothetical protein [bacterium]
MSKKEEFSKKNNNLEVIKEEDRKDIKKTEVSVSPREKSGGKNIFIGTLNLFTQPLKERHEKHYKDGHFHFFADVIFLSVILSLVGIFIAFYFWKPAQEIKLDILNKNEIILSGKQETFTIFYAHKGDRSVKEANLTINLPNNFLFQKAIPENIYDPNKHSFDLGKLSSGSNGEVKIIGIVLGEPGSRQVISSSLNYNLEGKEMRKLSSLIYNIEGSGLDFFLDLPKKVYKGNNFKGKINISNKTDLNWNQILLQFSPSHWSLSQVYGDGDYEWEDQLIKINNLAKDEKVVLNFDAFTDSEEGEYSLDFIFYGLNNELKIKQFEKSSQIKVVKPSFEINIISNKNNLKLGDSVSFKLNFTNKEKGEIKDVNFSITSMNPDFSLSDFSVSREDDYERKEDKIFLGDFELGEKKEIEILTDWTRNKIDTNQTLGLVLDLNYDFLGQRVNLSQFSPAVKILSQIEVFSAGYYYSPQGDQLGVGPLPPKVGIPTSYWVFWEIKNFGNDLSKIKMSADLPKGTMWADEKTLLAGNLMHGDISDRVVWDLEKIKSIGGEYSAGFKINLIPDEGDVGKVLNLLENVRFSVYDNFCNEIQEITLKGISTNLEDDELSSGKGIVVK